MGPQMLPSLQALVFVQELEREVLPVMPVQAQPVARCQQEVSSQPWAALALNSALTQQSAGRLEFV